MARSNKTVKKQNKGGERNGITPEFKKLVAEFMEEHKDVLSELAKR